MTSPFLRSDVPQDDDEALPSPSELKGKILIKGHKLVSGDESVDGTFEETEEETENQIWDLR